MSSGADRILPLHRIAGPDQDELIWAQFQSEVARRELAEWLPPRPHTILDLSKHAGGLLAAMLADGHHVIHAGPEPSGSGLTPRPARLAMIQADVQALDWLGPERVDVVVAEGSALSDALAAELTVDHLQRVLRPGGRLLLCVDSLVAGLARLADQGRWPELADVPAADVVLIPADDGRVTRCFWPEELHGMLSAAGFDVEWIRPRTVLTRETVLRALALDATQLSSLVTTELALARRRQGESIGAQLVASAQRR